MGQKLPKIAHIFLGKSKIENPAPCCDVAWVHLGGTAVRICGAKRAGRKLNILIMGKTIVIIIIIIIRRFYTAPDT